jgi:hypothetical protein
MKYLSHPRTSLIVILLFSASTLQVLCQSDCLERRDDISGDSFEPQDRALLADLIVDFLTSRENPSYQEGDDDYLIYELVAVNDNFGSQATQTTNSWLEPNQSFFDFHGDFIQILEQWLLDQGFPQFVPLPYWDPSGPIPIEFLTSMIPEFAADANMQLTQIEAGDWDMLDVDENVCAMFAGDYVVSINEFATELLNGADGLNNIKNEIGGALGDFTTAAGTGIYWLLQAHINDLYTCYEKFCNEDCEPIVIRGDAYWYDCTVCFDLSNSEIVNNEGSSNICTMEPESFPFALDPLTEDCSTTTQSDTPV